MYRTSISECRTLGSSSQPSLVSAQGNLARRAAVSDGLHAVHTERNEAAGPDTEHTQGSAQDPGHGAALRPGGGGDVLLTVVTGHVDWPVSE